MMKKNLDELLTHALAPTEEPPFALNQQLFHQAMEENHMKKRKIPAAALAAAMVLCFSSLTAFASWKYLSAHQVAEKMYDKKLADCFDSKDALLVNETQSCGGYRTTFLGLISGKALSDYENQGNVKGSTYAVVAIEKEDGTPMPDTSDESYGDLSFFVSPLIGGYDPVLYNAASMGGGYLEINEDGILYRLMECDNVEIFADHQMYLCVTDTTFYNAGLYNYDEANGTISRNEEYSGLNALFSLPLDPSRADPAEAAAYIESLHMESESDDSLPEAPVRSPEPDQSQSLSLVIQSGSETSGSGVSQQQSDLVGYALDFVGTPYKYGGASLTEGIDSSGFVKAVYGHFGYTLPHSASEDKNQGTAVESLEDAQAGDLICFDDPSRVAIYLGDDKIIHVNTVNGVEVISVTDEDLGKPSAIRRILSEE